MKAQPQHLDQDFDRLLGTFKAVAKLRSPLQRRFHLVRLASWHGLPKAEIRQLFDLWLQEKNAIGGEE